MANAIQILAEAYRQLNLAEPVNFLDTQFPGKISKDIINKVIRETNRLGNLWFMETETLLPYISGQAQIDLSSIGIDPNRIRYIRKTVNSITTELYPQEYRLFQQYFRTSSLVTRMPSYYSKFGKYMYFDSIPDQNYAITVYHFTDMPLVTSPNDTFLIPERDEDIFIDSCSAVLSARIGKITEAEAIGLIKIKMSPFLVQIKSDLSTAKQMPASF